MDIRAATTQLKPFIRFPFQDHEARSRFLIGSALTLGSFIVPIIPGLFASGYALRVMRSTAEGEAPRMPAWDDWGGFLSLGFRGAVVGFLFLLPSLAVSLLGMTVYFGAFLMLPFLTRPGGSGEEAFIVLWLLAMAVMFLSVAVATLLLVVGVIPLPASLTHFALKDELAAAFRVREWWPILSANALGYFITFVITLGIFASSYFAFYALYSTLILACLGFLVMLPFNFYISLVGGALFGDAYREGNQLAYGERPDRP
jgi:hypothetical protein